MSIITQRGDTALMMAAREGRTEVVSQLIEAAANILLQNKVKMSKRRRCFDVCLVESVDATLYIYYYAVVGLLARLCMFPADACSIPTYHGYILTHNSDMV